VALGALADAENVHHETLYTALSASLLRRQTMFLVFASLDWVPPEAMAANLRSMNLEGCPPDGNPFQVIGHALGACRRVRDLLHAAYGPWTACSEPSNVSVTIHCHERFIVIL
jgi:hypothetical protein